MVAPESAEYEPAAQGAQAAAPATTAVVPAPQLAHDAAPAAEDMPAAQTAHVAAEVAPVAVEYVPGRQLVQAPAASLARNDPRGQEASHAGAPVAEKAPAVHATHEEEVTDATALA
jgi:hypothetical protein